MRVFETGATRDSDTGKLDYEGFLSPVALEAFAKYMHKHRTQADGSLRDSDNWQKGIPLQAYMKSLIRHVFELWRLWRRGTYQQADAVDVACAVWFNIQGFIHESLKPRAVDIDVGPETIAEATPPLKETGAEEAYRKWRDAKSKCGHCTHTLLVHFGAKGGCINCRCERFV